MQLHNTISDISKDVEVRMFFEQTNDQKIIVEKIQMSKNATQGEVCDKILYAWGKSPKIEEINFVMAQAADGAVIVSRPDLLKFVDSRHAQFL